MTWPELIFLFNDTLHLSKIHFYRENSFISEYKILTEDEISVSDGSINSELKVDKLQLHSISDISQLKGLFVVSLMFSCRFKLCVCV